MEICDISTICRVSKKCVCGVIQRIGGYYHKIRKSVLSKIFFIEIPCNVFDEGLLISHLHNMCPWGKMLTGNALYLEME